MGNGLTSRYAWARDFEPTPAETRVLAATEAGEWCDFEEKTTIRGLFLRILMLGARSDWPVAPAGVMIRAKKPADENAPRLLTIEGPLDLTDARAADGLAADGRALPALYHSARALHGTRRRSSARI